MTANCLAGVELEMLPLTFSPGQRDFERGVNRTRSELATAKRSARRPVLREETSFSYVQRAVAIFPAPWGDCPTHDTAQLKEKKKFTIKESPGKTNH